MAFYRVDFKPLEPYTFGTEQGTKYNGVNGTGKESYIMTTNYLPDQTTILGTLRYLILRAAGELNTDFEYAGNTEKIEALIGKESFSFSADTQEFGELKSISPVFLYDGTEKYVPNPFCNVAQIGFEPMKLLDTVQSSKGMVRMPPKGPNGYDAKEGYSEGFFALSDGKKLSLNELFSKVTLVGNQISKSDSGHDSDEEGFFKREAAVLDDRFSFSVYAEIDEGRFEEKSIQVAYMGRKNSAFQITVEKISNETAELASDILRREVEEAFNKLNSRLGETWYYALSDIYSGEPFSYKEFALVEEKHIRNLETIYTADSYVGKRKKSERINLLCKGSSFFEMIPDAFVNRNCEKVGYNIIVKIGGNN